jgi:CLIP-associating protein 1/2
LTDANFITLTNALINCLDDPTPSVRDLAIQTINTLIIRNPSKLSPILTETLNDLVKGFYSEDRSLHQATEDLIEEILSCHNNPEVITVVTKTITLTEIPATQAIIRQLTKAIKRLPAESIVGYLRMVMDKMKECFNHNNADVRKSVVFCLVEIFILLGRRFQPYLDELSPSQQKLVNIYIQRRQESYV